MKKCTIAAAFGRLCVETTEQKRMEIRKQAAAFGRLCVETRFAIFLSNKSGAAAFGRLCVETFRTSGLPLTKIEQPPSGGCVLKPSCAKC